MVMHNFFKQFEYKDIEVYYHNETEFNRLLDFLDKNYKLLRKMLNNNSDIDFSCEYNYIWFCYDGVIDDYDDSDYYKWEDSFGFDTDDNSIHDWTKYSVDEFINIITGIPEELISKELEW